MKKYKFIVLIAFAIGMFACNAWNEDIVVYDSNLSKNIKEIIEQNSNLSSFLKILKLTGYDQLLEGNTQYTVFAPDNEALKNLDLTNIDSLKSWVQNHIATLNYYTDKSGNMVFGDRQVKTIEMINGKLIRINSSTITSPNNVGSNGVLHILNQSIQHRMNVLDYLKTQSGYAQLDYIQGAYTQVMDSAKSIQKGVDINGKPIYDTVWTVKNVFLDKYPLADESKQFTMILLDNTAFEKIKAKYAKYFVQKNKTNQSSEINWELNSDLVLKFQQISNNGRFTNFNEVLVDINPDNIVETYQASNGIVYKVTDADIKIYENKIKTQIIEGEDYTGRFDSQNAWTVRYRPWASGGKDAVLKGLTRWTFNWNIYYPANDSTAPQSRTNSYSYPGDTYVQSKTTNAYIQYNPKMYSCDYEMYWVSYDDVSSHHFTIPDTGRVMPMGLEQKLMISFPGETVLRRESDGKISNNFSELSVMAGKSYAGTLEETKLVRYRLNADNKTVGSPNEKLYLLDVVSNGVDAFGSGSILKCPYYGNATFFVANTTRQTATYAGLIYLDYIKLVPKVDMND